MLQIILAVIGVTFISAMGFILVQQMTLQQRVLDSRENDRRLDVAAEALANALGRLPGVETLLPPVPGTIGGITWNTMPAGVGGVNATVNNVPFLYCPLPPVLSAAELNGVLGPVGSRPAPLTLTMPQGTYQYSATNNFVVEHNLAVHSSLNSLSPVAMIIAPNSISSFPPRCDDVRLVNNRPTVEGGRVRVVSLPANSTSSTGSSLAAQFWVQAGQRGLGTRANSPTTIDAAFEHFARYNPSTMTINVIGTNTVSSAVLTRFLAASVASNSTIRIIGSGSGAVVDFGGAATWGIPSQLILQNVSISGPRIVVSPGDVLTTLGSVGLSVSSGTGMASNILVQTGGRMFSDGSFITVATGGAVDAAIVNFGTVDVRSTRIAPVNVMQRVMTLQAGGVLRSTSSTLGNASFRTTNPSVQSVGSGGDLVVSDSASVIIASSSNVCWGWQSASDVMFQWSGVPLSTNQLTQRSAVVSEAGYPRPDATADVATQTAYQNGFNSRALARRLNASNFLCS